MTKSTDNSNTSRDQQTYARTLIIVTEVHLRQPRAYNYAMVTARLTDLSNEINCDLELAMFDFDIVCDIIKRSEHTMVQDMIDHHSADVPHHVHTNRK